MPSWGHEYAGVIAFVLEAAGIVSIVYHAAKKECMRRSSLFYIIACAIAAADAVSSCALGASSGSYGVCFPAGRISLKARR